jgi:hypothetical protein
MSEDLLAFSNRSNLDSDDYYIGKDGYIIFTEKYHSKRGYCCKSACLHCPFGYDKKTNDFKKKN